MNCVKLHLIPVLLGVLIGLPDPARADKPDFLVNNDNGTAEQNLPRIAVAGDGGFVIAWVDKRSGSADVFLQRFTQDGTPIGSNRRVNDDLETAYQSEPAIAADLSGHYSVVWKDYRSGAYPFGPEVFFQRYDTSLSPIGVNLAITVEQPDSLKETPDIALAPWGGGVIVWADYRTRNWDIYGQLVNSDGSTVGANFRVNDDPGTAQQHAPRVAVSPEGWFVVTWYDNRSGHDDIYVQRFDGQADRLGTNVRVNSDAGTVRQAFPDVATDGAGHITVVWVDWRNGVYPANPDIYARKYDTTMSPLTSDELVNQDGTRRAQREPTIAADHRGNVAIIWSDSSGTTQSYDIVGQMIDVDGVIREVNFEANSEADSAQLHADVALDGRYRYITWADKRNGNYDIYASITQYNDPTLAPSPSTLYFEMLAGDGLPPAQQVTVDHYGYNRLNFQVTRSHSWIQVSPSSGLTPATLDVSIATDTLPFGTYLGTLMLHDLDNDDSTVHVSVRLDVTAPVLELSTDTLRFRVFAGLQDSAYQTFDIANTGAGDLMWAISESLDWLWVEPVSGSGDGAVRVWVNGQTLNPGLLLDSIIVEAADAVNSPAVVVVRVEAANNQPYMALLPDSIYVATEAPAEPVRFAVVTNLGAGSLDWTATTIDPWLMIQPVAGGDGDTVWLSVDTAGLAPGPHIGSIDFFDQEAYHQTVRLPYVLDYLLPGNDTLLVADLDLAPLESDSVLVRAFLIDSATYIRLPLTFDPSLASVDRVTFPVSTSGHATSFSIDNSRGLVDLSVTARGADSALAPSAFDFAWIHLASGAQYGLFEITESVDPGTAAVVATPSGLRTHPIVLAGQVRVEAATGVEPNQPTELPAAYALEQNYPNPFNPSTTIRLSLPVQNEIELEVFNILGQRVRLLVQATLPAGIHKLLWDGRFEDQREAPTGIYFYRLRAPGVSLVRKMVLLK